MSKQQTNHDNILQVDSPVGKHIQTEISSVSTTRKRKLLHTQLLSQMDLNLFVAPSDLFDLKLIKHLERIKINLEFLVVDKLPFEVIVGEKRHA